MSIAEAKSLLHKLVVETDDLDILSQVTYLFNVLKTKNTDWWDTLSLDQKKLIDKGIKQMEKNEGILHEKVRQEINTLLQKKQST